MGESVSFAEYVDVLRRRSRWVIAGFCVVVGLILLGLRLAPVAYTARAQVLFSVTAGLEAGGISDGTVYTERHIETYQALAGSPVVLNKVIADLKLDTSAEALSESLTVTYPKSTALLDITASAASSQTAAAVANAVADELPAAANAIS
ncbi:MAG: Wzz/FepE/Etk N-terminal domain-containing protein, partial [Dermatophilaceae bacterium]